MNNGLLMPQMQRMPQPIMMPMNDAQVVSMMAATIFAHNSDVTVPQAVASACDIMVEVMNQAGPLMERIRNVNPPR